MVTRIHGRGRVRNPPLRIAEWMAHYRLDDARLAGRMGVARETVTRYRNGIRKPNVAAMAHAMDPDNPPDLLKLPPTEERPSVDAVLRNAPDGIVRSVYELAIVLAKTGS